MVKSGERWFLKQEKWGSAPDTGESGVSAMFRGEYDHTVDTKGRLIIPSKFREQLGDECIVTRGLDGCLFVFPLNEWEAYEDKLRKLPTTNKNARSFVRFLTAGATSCEFDKQGRILLPATLRRFAGIEKDVVLAGLLNRIEIWSEQKWNENNNFEEIDMDEIAGQLTELGLDI